MRLLTCTAWAAVVSISLWADSRAANAQALTRAADARRENVVESNFDRLRSAAYASYTRHEYALQPDGNLRGTVRNVDSVGTLSPSRVKLFFVRHGEIVSQSTPNREGMFQAGGLAPGYYSVISYGQGGFSSTGIRVVPPPEKSAAPKANTIGRERLVSAVDAQTAGADVLHLTPIQTIDVAPAFGLSRMMNGVPMAPGVSAAPKTPSNGATVSTVAASKAAAAKKFVFDDSGLSDDVLVEAYEHNAYHLRTDGMLAGQLRGFDDVGELVPTPHTPIFLLRNGRVVSQGRTDGAGFYQLAGVGSGYYSFVVAGSGKFGAVGISVLPPLPVEEVPVPKTKSIGNIRPVAFAMQGEGTQNQGGTGPSTGAAATTDTNAVTQNTGANTDTGTNTNNTAGANTTGAAGAAGAGAGAGALGAVVAGTVGAVAGTSGSDSQPTANTGTTTVVDPNPDPDSNNMP